MIAKHLSFENLTIKSLVGNPLLMEVTESTEQLIRPTHHKVKIVIWPQVAKEVSISFPFRFVVEEVYHVYCITMVTKGREMQV